MVAQLPASRRRPRTGADDPIAELVGRLDLERYKAVIRGLTQFGDRRQGTRRNRDAVDWIEAQLEAAGCPTERHHYIYDPPPRPSRPRGAGDAPLNPPGPTPTGGRIGRNGSGPGGSSIFGYRRPTGVVRDPLAQPDEALRALNLEEPTNGERSQVYCTKVGATRPGEMYILGAHMDGHGFGEGADDDASGHRAGDGAGAHPQRAGRRDRRVDPLRALEQRGDRTQRQPRLRGGPARAAGRGRPARLRPLPRAPLAGDDPARHDAVRPRRAGAGRRGQPAPAPRGRHQHRVPVELGPGRRVPATWPSASRPPTTPTPPTIPRPSGPT